MGCWFCNVPRLRLTGRRSCCIVVVVLLLLSCQSPRDNPLRRHHTILSACPLFMAGGIPSFLPPFSLSPGNHRCCEHPPITCALAHGGTSAGPPREDGWSPFEALKRAKRNAPSGEVKHCAARAPCCAATRRAAQCQRCCPPSTLPPFPPLFFFLSISISERCGGGLSSCLADLTLPAVPWQRPVHWNTTSSCIQFN